MFDNYVAGNLVCVSFMSPATHYNYYRSESHVYVSVGILATRNFVSLQGDWVNVFLQFEETI